MNDPNQDPDKLNVFKPSNKILALRRKQQPLGLPNPGKFPCFLSLISIAASGSQIQSQKIGYISFLIDKLKPNR